MVQTGVFVWKDALYQLFINLDAAVQPKAALLVKFKGLVHQKPITLQSKPIPKVAQLWTLVST